MTNSETIIAVEQDCPVLNMTQPVTANLLDSCVTSRKAYSTVCRVYMDIADLSC